MPYYLETSFYMTTPGSPWSAAAGPGASSPRASAVSSKDGRLRQSDRRNRPGDLRRRSDHRVRSIPAMRSPFIHAVRRDEGR